MEYLPLGSLFDENKRSRLTSSECVVLLRQSLQGLEHLHTHGYAHRDVKPANILLKSRVPLHIQISDFGLSHHVDTLFTFCGTAGYIAPEITSSHRVFGARYSPAVDIWSLGVVMLEICYIGIRNQGRSTHEILLELKILTNDPLSDLLSSKMVVQDPVQRSSSTICLSEAYKIPLDICQDNPANLKVEKPQHRHTPPNRPPRGIFEGLFHDNFTRYQSQRALTGFMPSPPARKRPPNRYTEARASRLAKQIQDREDPREVPHTTKSPTNKRPDRVLHLKAHIPPTSTRPEIAPLKRRRNENKESLERWLNYESTLEINTIR